MKKATIALAASLLAFSGAGFAQSQTPSPTSEIRESTDPARYDDVMRRAQEIQNRQTSSSDMSSGASDTTTTKKAGKRMQSKKSMKRGKGGGSSNSSSGASSGSDSSSGQDTGTSK
ncbi:hypothetical protein [Noviherbaspirillum sp. ST9]|uniref:hypothetical protein n=1 Tax=Noviherbaspirillum sp. ST9 TaxID=3401606 RepID=UPI003B589C89